MRPVQSGGVSPLFIHMVCLGLCRFLKALVLSLQRSVGLSLGACPLTFVTHSLIQQISASMSLSTAWPAIILHRATAMGCLPLGTVPGID